MRRLSARTLAVVSLAGLVAAAAAPALAKPSRPKQHRGKKAVGEIVSFDEATMTLTVDLRGDEDFTGAVDPDVQVKLDHRGWAGRGGDHGNPTEGSTDDLLPGTPVLRMKVEDDLVTKIRIRPLPDQAPLPPAEDDGEDDGTAGGDDTLEEPADDSGDDPTDDSDSNPDDESDGDAEDALPPLPVPLP
ncbi:MAG TPA: hypothetical protein VHJ76_02700 [Actinomycetota bacterium]|nr:hypothetical protein [Actinomycetota bacterium]